MTVADYLNCMHDQNVLLVAAHRGGPAPGFPENAVETFERTQTVGAMVLEIDVRRTSDGKFVLMHDETLDRTSTGKGSVDEATLAQIQALQLKDNEGNLTPYHAPSLKQALDWGRDRAMLQLDVKPGSMVEDVVRFVVELEAQSYAAVVVYSVEDALRAAAASPDITVSVEVTDLARLKHLEDGGLPTNRIMAWTGVETQRVKLWLGLSERGVTSAWGAMWYLDRDVKSSGDPSPFEKLAQTQLDIVSSDIPDVAFEALSKTQDLSTAVGACNARTR